MRRARRRTSQFKQFNQLNIQSKYVWTNLNERVNYTKYENSSSYSAATFDEEKQTMNREIIDNIYSTAYVDQRDGLMNRSLQNNIQNGHQLDAFLEYNNSFKFKKNSDGLSYTAFKGRWVFMLDGFDILNQLSNVTYGVNAQARTSTVLAAHVLTI